MQLIVVLIIIAVSIAYAVWSVGRTWTGKSCDCPGCGVSDTKNPER